MPARIAPLPPTRGMRVWDDSLEVHRREIVLVRHGETEWSGSGRHTGRTDTR